MAEERICRTLHLTPLSLGRGGGPPEDAIGMLLACHQRIRSFSALAVRLAEASGAPRESRAEAAASVHRYFRVALPLHVADEELSLRPRLLATPARDQVAAHLALMSAQHDEVERQLAGLTPSWSALASSPERSELLRTTAPLARDFERLMHDHLALEEQHIFPAARRYLTLGSMQALLEEIRGRRAPAGEKAPPAKETLQSFLTADHARLDALLARATAQPDAIDRSLYEEFRAGLLRHIGMEEKILLPFVRRRREGEPLPIAGQLKHDHAALAALLVPTPTKSIIHALRAVLGAHNPLEEDPGGLYETCDKLAAGERGTLLQRLQAAPPVSLAPHFDGPRAFESIERLLRAAGRPASRIVPED